MHKTLTAGAVGGLMFAIGVGAIILPQGQSPALKIGYIDSQAVIAAYPGTVEAQASFQAENAAWERRANDLQSEIQRLANEIERSSLATSQDRKNQMNADLQRKSLEYQQYVNTIWGQEGQAFLRNQELMQPVLDKLNVLIEQLGTSEGYSFILDAATGAILHADPSHDLTPRLIEMMNSGDEPDPR